MAADPTLADLLEHDAAQSYFALPLPGYDDRLRTAAVRLRKLDAIEEAAKWYGAVGEGVQSGWHEAAYDEVSELLRRIADALGGTEP